MARSTKLPIELFPLLDVCCLSYKGRATHDCPEGYDQYDSLSYTPHCCRPPS
jgi:hypothetical protein